jgi:hypothetical protein
MGFARNQIADDVGAHHLFVNGIGHDVLGVELHTEPPPAIRGAARTATSG